ncbi:50S ribosomal protein L23 [Fundidesulfovibrio butyratiphilus]
MSYANILLKPLISEKATRAKEEANQVIFYVASKANKLEIKQAVEEAFKVKVTEVNVIRRQPMVRRRHGRAVGRIAGYKKAYVTLAEGDKIDLFEGV